MAAIDFKNAVARLYFDAGLTEDGKVIRKSKTYRNIAEQATPDQLHNALNELSGLCSFPVLGAEKIETSTVMN